MRRILFAVLILLALFTTIAATTDSAETAAKITAVAGVILPFLLKLVPAAGHYMVAITLAASLLIAGVAMWYTGELVLTNLSATNLPLLLSTALSAWGLSQIVYATLTQHPSTAKLVE